MNTPSTNGCIKTKELKISLKQITRKTKGSSTRRRKITSVFTIVGVRDHWFGEFENIHSKQ